MVARMKSVGSEVLSSTVVSKLFWRIIPLLFLLVMLNYIDRSNLGFAALQMNSQLGFTPAGLRHRRIDLLHRLSLRADPCQSADA